MILRCINIDEAAVPKVLPGHQPHPQYIYNGLTVGKIYVVYGMAIYGDALRVLVRHDNGHPFWYVPQLFEVVDDHFPPYWGFRFFNIEGRTIGERHAFQAIWGYRELVDDLRHNAGLMDGESVHLEIFEAEAQRRASYNV
jgi:hypothetical protein